MLSLSENVWLKKSQRNTEEKIDSRQPDVLKQTLFFDLILNKKT
jgi:hypothetical protein